MDVPEVDFGAENVAAHELHLALQELGLLQLKNAVCEWDRLEADLQNVEETGEGERVCVEKRACAHKGPVVLEQGLSDIRELAPDLDADGHTAGLSRCLQHDLDREVAEKLA
jgi:hypothetical protein